MGEWIKVTAQDGHELSAYVARPQGQEIGGLVLVQEIFGVNQHIQNVCDGFARDGFLVVAPAIFDRIETQARSRRFRCIPVSIQRNLCWMWRLPTSLQRVK